MTQRESYSDLRTWSSTKYVAVHHMMISEFSLDDIVSMLSFVDLNLYDYHGTEEFPWEDKSNSRRKRARGHKSHSLLQWVHPLKIPKRELNHFLINWRDGKKVRRAYKYIIKTEIGDPWKTWASPRVCEANLNDYAPSFYILQHITIGPAYWP
jgi:hypothetical protein